MTHSRTPVAPASAFGGDPHVGRAAGPSVIIIGGGIIGLAVAYKLRLSHPTSEVTVLEKEPRVGQHQSGHNSGVLHAGLYYAPGSFKARLAVSGIRQMTAFCEAHRVPHEICGKLVVAADASEIPRLRELLRRGEANGLSGLRWLSAPEMREVEPHVGGVAAVHAPEEGIADYPKVCETLASEIVRLGGRVVTGARVRALQHRPHGWHADTTIGDVSGEVLVNCAGLQSDRVARMAGERPGIAIIPFRGEYYTLRPERRYLVRNLIYPVPDPSFPFLGVHFTRHISGAIEAGPNAVLAFAREGYRKSTVRPYDLAHALAFPGLWRFVARHPRMTVDEIRRSFSRRRFADALARLVPDITPGDLAPGGAGVRAQAVHPTGELANDFVFLSGPHALHVLNAPSPGATASLAIGDEIVRSLASQLGAPADTARLTS